MPIGLNDDINRDLCRGVITGITINWPGINQIFFFINGNYQQLSAINQQLISNYQQLTRNYFFY